METVAAPPPPITRLIVYVIPSTYVQSYFMPKKDCTKTSGPDMHSQYIILNLNQVSQVVCCQEVNGSVDF